MSRLLSALHFACWAYFWTLALFAAFILALRYSEAWRHPGEPWWSPAALWANLEGVWFLPLPLFPAALLAFWLSPRWGRGLTLLLTPLLLSVWMWTPYQMPGAGLLALMSLVLPGALLAAIPPFIRARRRRVP